MTKEVMQMALDALECWQRNEDCNEPMSKILEALRTALAQPEPVAMKFQIYKQTPPRGGELKPINSALLPWVYDQDPSSGNTASMWVTPVATLPPKREWVGLTDKEYEAMAEQYVTNCYFDTLKYAKAIEAKLKEKNS